MVKVGSWTTYYQVVRPQRVQREHHRPDPRPQRHRRPAGRRVRLLGARLGEVSFRTGLPARRGDRRRPLGRGQGARRRDLRGVDDAVQRGAPGRLRDPHPPAALVLHHALSARPRRDGVRSQTMRFRNDTKYPILIRGFASPGFVRYEIWSVPNGRTVSLSRPHGHECRRRAPTRGQDAALCRGHERADRVAGRRQGRRRDPHRARRRRPGDPPRDVRVALPPDDRDQPDRDRVARAALSRPRGGPACFLVPFDIPPAVATLATFPSCDHLAVG